MVDPARSGLSIQTPNLTMTILLKGYYQLQQKHQLTNQRETQQSDIKSGRICSKQTLVATALTVATSKSISDMHTQKAPTTEKNNEGTQSTV